jgi:hypothetical protein
MENVWVWLILSCGFRLHLEQLAFAKPTKRFSAL